MRSDAKVLGVSTVLALALVSGACHKRTPAVPAAATTAPEAAPPAPPPPSCTLTAEPASVDLGQSVTISWESHDATASALEPHIGAQQARGSTSVAPQESTTYTLEVSGPGGKSSCSVRVTVTVPPPAVRPSVKEENIGTPPESALKDAFFDLDKAAIRPDAHEALTADAEYLKAHPEVKITIEGHCDERGSEEYNLGLGDRRATSARNFLADLGVARERMSTISFGKNRPVCTEATEECWQQNRRVHPAVGARSSETR